MPEASKKNITNILNRILIKCTLAVLIVFAAAEATSAYGNTQSQDFVLVRPGISGIPYQKGLVQGQHTSSYSSTISPLLVCSLGLPFKPLQLRIAIKNNAGIFSLFPQFFFPLLNISGFSFKKQAHSFL